MLRGAAAVGLIIRDPRSQPGLGTSLRISVGTPEQNDRLLRGIAQLHGSSGMSGDEVLFIDRDGTLIVEPADQQIDRLAKLRLLPGVIPALLTTARCRLCVRHGHQSGRTWHGELPGERVPRSPGIPARAARRRRASASKPSSSVRTLLRTVAIAASRKPVCSMSSCASMPSTCDRSYVIGDRDTDMELARNLGIGGIRVRSDRTPGETWPQIAAASLRRCATRANRPQDEGNRHPGRRAPRSKKRRSASRPASASSITCSNRSRSTAGSLCSSPARAICISTSTTPSRIARLPWGRR